jgi:hypothetical protein
MIAQRRFRALEGCLIYTVEVFALEPRQIEPQHKAADSLLWAHDELLEAAAAAGWDDEIVLPMESDYDVVPLDENIITLARSALRAFRHRMPPLPLPEAAETWP